MKGSVWHDHFDYKFTTKGQKHKDVQDQDYSKENQHEDPVNDILPIRYNSIDEKLYAQKFSKNRKIFIV